LKEKKKKDCSTKRNIGSSALGNTKKRKRRGKCVPKQKSDRRQNGFSGKKIGKSPCPLMRLYIRVRKGRGRGKSSEGGRGARKPLEKEERTVPCPSGESTLRGIEEEGFVSKDRGVRTN